MSGFAGVLACGGSAFVSVTRSYTTGTSATETIPAGATNVTIEAWGGTGIGGSGISTGCVTHSGGGAGSGGYCKTVLSAVPGQTIIYTVGTATVSSGTFTLTTMTANSTGAGNGATSTTNGAAKIGGAASGGNTTNTTGNSGAAGSVCAGGAGGAGIVGTNGTGNPGGHGGSDNANLDRTGGFAGLIIFNYT